MAKFNPFHPSAIRRHYETREARAIEEHSCLLGQAMWAWNKLHEAYAFIFASITEAKQNPAIGLIIWPSLASDRAQRDVLMNVLRWGLLGHATKTKQILWSINVANKLSVYRNDMTHALPGFLIGDDGLRIHPSSAGNPISRLMRTDEKDTRLILAHLRDDLVDLEFYTRSPTH